MKQIKNVKQDFLRLLIIVCLSTSFMLQGCATKNKTIAAGILGGSLIGAGVGHNLNHQGSEQLQSQNTILSAILFGALTGGFLSWHFKEIEDQKVAISGRYARYRLCNPDDMDAYVTEQLEMGEKQSCTNITIDPEQIEESAISLDDNTKWVYPQFRKRYLQPERGEMQVVSKRYLWEIIKQGYFVTRSQNPHYFLQTED